MRPRAGGDLRPGGYRPGTQHTAGVTADRPRPLRFRFDEHGVPLPVVADVLAAFADRQGAGELALWFTGANGWFGDRRPAMCAAAVRRRSRPPLRSWPRSWCRRDRGGAACGGGVH